MALFLALGLVAMIGTLYDRSINQELNTTYLVISLSSFLFAYKFSPSFLKKNALSNLIKRQDGIVEISRLKTAPWINVSKKESIEASRISQVTISNNLLSIIIDGNGRGYDFQLAANQSQIKEHFCSLFSESELVDIDLNVMP